MAATCNLLTEHTPFKDDWHIKVKIIKLWKLPSYKNPMETFRIELILLDVENHEKSLGQDMFVYISEFGVTDSDAKDTFVVKHPYKINFYKTKRVKKCDEFSGPVYGNNFKPFTDLLQERQHSTFAYDLIGDITSCGKIETKEEAHGKLKRFIRIEMQDTMYIPNLYLYSPDVLNGLKLSGIPNHRLALKVGAPVMLLRNINQSAGLCNGIRLGITKLGKRFIEAEIITGTKVGEQK
ncbi:nucleic acid-binding, OB-fold, replication protein A, OB domain protein [Tanacetum coccineum]